VLICILPFLCVGKLEILWKSYRKGRDEGFWFFPLLFQEAPQLEAKESILEYFHRFIRSGALIGRGGESGLWCGLHTQTVACFLY